MSGSGRKSHYRKSVTDQFLNGFPLPTENEKVVRMLNSRGTNIFEVICSLACSKLGLRSNCRLS